MADTIRLMMRLDKIDTSGGVVLTDRNLSLDEGAERLGISVHTLRAWSVYQRRVPFLRMGRRILFKLSDLEAFERRNRVEAREVPPP
jgi:excisionase family DNA binding protein